MITRRTIIKTGAWSVPAVGIAVASPAFATSVKCNKVKVKGTPSLTELKEYTYDKKGRKKHTGKYFYATEISFSEGTALDAVVTIAGTPALFTGAYNRNKYRFETVPAKKKDTKKGLLIEVKDKCGKSVYKATNRDC